MITSRHPDSLDGWLHLLERRHPKSIDLGLERCRAVWRRMGSPRPAERIFVVAGTNGKGSVVATLCSLLSALGYAQGSYTSPHLFRFNERVLIGGRETGDADWLEAFSEVEEALNGTSLSYFEFTTLAAFRLMARHRLDFAVMEVGLGGRLDAVNLLDGDCAVITSLGLDHQDYLGEDLESIGREKAGIMRPDRPVICGEPDPPDSVRNAAREAGASLFLAGRDFQGTREGNGLAFRAGRTDLALPLPALAGPYQIGNAATALAALLQLLPQAAGQPEALAAGMTGVRLAGRLEQVGRRPAIWVDVGHNALAARAISEALEERMANEGIGRCRCVLGMLSDKDAEAVAEALSPVVGAWYCGGLEGDRGQGGSRLAARVAGALPGSPVSAHDSIAAALQAALEASGPGDGLLVFGSFFTAAEALNELTRAAAQTRPPGN